jgi:hypothetical protein
MTRPLIAALALGLASTGLSAQTTGAQRLAWLQGCWALHGPERIVEEQWMAPRAGSLLGMSRTLRGGKLTAYESVLLREHGERFEYVVSPSGQATTTFTSTSVGESSIVFENLQHDFPQRVAYERRGAVLQAWIEGPMNGRTKRIEFAYQRVPCGGVD